MTEPWDLEPDITNFMDGEYFCVIKKIPELLHLCGYVGIPFEHPFYNKDIKYLNEHLEVHGGITFLGKISESPMIYMGFDCAHMGDLSPLLIQTLPEVLKLVEDAGETYKDSKYVRNEINSLVNQLRKYEKKV